jgi:hypothetical protein
VRVEQQDECDRDRPQTLDVGPKSSILGRRARFLTRVMRAFRYEERLFVNRHCGRTMEGPSTVGSRRP